MAEFSINVTVAGHIATLEWNGPATPELLHKTISLATDDALIARGVHRVEVSLPAGDDMARTALHQAGFRLDGIRRAALKIRDGEFVDVVQYSRLATDVVYGQVGHTSVLNTIMPRKRLIAHVLFRDDAGKVLVCEPVDSDGWFLPGGTVADFETPHSAAVRACMEELSFDAQIGRVLVVDWLPPFRGWDDAVELVFDGGVLTREQVSSLRPDGREVTTLLWVDPVADFGDIDHVSAGTAKRLVSALEALESGSAQYLENSQPLSN